MECSIEELPYMRMVARLLLIAIVTNEIVRYDSLEKLKEMKRTRKNE